MRNWLVLTFLLIFTIFLSANQRETVIENFESGYIDFLSYENEDMEPDSLEFSTEITTSAFSQYSLCLYGNTWKLEMIDPIQIEADDAWQIDVYIENIADIQGVGFSDGTNTLFYSFGGTEMLNIEEWVPVYQGINYLQEWFEYPLPIADDWFAWYEYYPQINRLIFVNDADDNQGKVYFDDLVDITEDLPVAPQVEITYTIGREYRSKNGKRSIDVEFFSTVIDPDSDEHNYFWDFGDDSTSIEENPLHTFLVQDDHDYTVLLQVCDDSNTWGYDNCQIEVEPGETSFPVTMNFAGDLMLARNMENIISNYGIESIFDPTYDVFGGAADITVANLECPLTDYNQPHPTKTIYFKGDPDYAAGLAYAGIDIVCLANNHVYDYLLPGIEETQAALDSVGVLHSGAGADSYEAYLPLFYSKAGVNIAFLASSDRTGQYNNYQPYLQAGMNKPGFAYMTPYYITQQIEAVEDVADLIVIETHSGSEYSTAPGANYDQIDIFAGWDKRDFAEDEDYTPRLDIPHMWDIEIRHHMIDSGADLVVCHHPHIIQGVEIYNGKLIAHSLGDFVFDLNYAETFPSMILNTKINENGFYEYSLTPLYVDDYIPRPATGALGNYIMDYIAMRSRELNTWLDVNRQTCEAKVIIDTNSVNTRVATHYLSADLQQEGNMWVSAPIFLPRVGCLSRLTQILPHGNYEYRLGREIVWNGNYEEEGSSEWNINSDDEWLDDVNPFAGEYSLCLRRESSAPGNVITNLENRLKNISGNEFTVHGNIRTENGSGATIQLRCYQYRTSGSHFHLQALDAPVNGDTDWNFYYNNITLPDDANYLNLNANCDPPATGEALSWFDNIGLISWEEWLPIEFVSIDIQHPNDYYYLQIRSADPIDRCTVQLNETAYSEFFVQTQDDVLPQAQIAQLNTNYPNPFNPSTQISFSLKTDTKVELAVFNVKGQKVKQLVSDVLTTGQYAVNWNGKNENEHEVASGIYFYQLKAGKNEIHRRKCLLLK